MRVCIRPLNDLKYGSQIFHAPLIENYFNMIFTSRMQALGEQRCVLHRARARARAAVVYCSNPLSWLRLHVARLYLHCGISHWVDI